MSSKIDNNFSPEKLAHLLKLKQAIAPSIPNFEERVTKAWAEILEELATKTVEISKAGSTYIPQVKFSDLDILPPETIQEIKRKGSVVIKDVVDDDEAISWRKSLVEFVKANPDVEGIPADDKQFFQLFWTKAQVQARAHPNILKTTTFLNNLYSGDVVDGVDLNVPLSYADRFRMRHPGNSWDFHPPHVDGGNIERWEDEQFRTCFQDILSGDWRKHNPYDLTGRLRARTSLYRRPNQATIFRTFQGWTAISETGPSRGTLKVFPDVLLSNAYTILRPFMRPTVAFDSKDIWNVQNWKYDISSPEFPGILSYGSGFLGPRPTPESHPNMRLEETMISIPDVKPGDTVWWHCDLVHAVETEHTGNEDSAVMYIPAVPLTPMNQAYIEKQRESFLRGIRPSDFPQGVNEDKWIGTATVQDITNPMGLRAMGLPVAVA